MHATAKADGLQVDEFLIVSLATRRALWTMDQW